ncbi:hypothetical protein [Pseudoflavonifractor phocaeensis]|uniref:hypothetical protein n=1 Tax=Pseudoflavonifractor phocaeensis TaxID=1870988 RepID=UPI00210B89ED|nr:hypothetical protein [Pseudoflavonifractor phocaeensis]MCQ4865588.1 hypothetical protein [Pseudoflavonifractor phocaeensis]
MRHIAILSDTHGLLRGEVLSRLAGADAQRAAGRPISSGAATARSGHSPSRSAAGAEPA